MKKNRVKKEFCQASVKLVGLVQVICPDCYEYFGLNTIFVEKTSSTLYRYTCPYCGGKHLLRND